MNYFLAIDIGGTKIAAAIFKQGTLVDSVTAKSETGTSETMFNSLMGAINDVLTLTNVKREAVEMVGLMLPGQIDFENEIALYQNNLPWKNFPIGNKIRDAFPKAGLVLKLDVQAAAIGEWVAKGKPDDMFVYVTISTGISASTIYQGKRITGGGLAGEFGYMKDEQGRTLETVASGSAMEREVRSKYNYESMKDAFDAFQRGEEEMIAYFSGKAALIARSLYNLFTIIDPQAVVLGGGVVNKQPQFYDLIVTHFEKLAHHPKQEGRSERISRSVHKEMSGIHGLLG